MAPPVRTFMDVSVGDAPPNRIIFELFVDKVPKTAEKYGHTQQRIILRLTAFGLQLPGIMYRGEGNLKVVTTGFALQGEHHTSFDS